MFDSKMYVHENFGHSYLHDMKLYVQAKWKMDQWQNNAHVWIKERFAKF